MEEAGASARSQAALKNGRRLEADRLGSGDLHGLSSLWVTALTSGALFDFESSETDDLDFLVLLHTFGDGRENGFEGFIGSTLGFPRAAWMASMSSALFMAATFLRMQPGVGKRKSVENKGIFFE